MVRFSFVKQVEKNTRESLRKNYNEEKFKQFLDHMTHQLTLIHGCLYVI